MSLPTARREFVRTMSTSDLLRWLEARGVGELDCKKIGENGFTGESFLLLDNQTMKEMGVKVGGQMVIRRLLAEARATSGSYENMVAAQNPSYTQRTSSSSSATALDLVNDPRVRSVIHTNNFGAVSNVQNPIQQNSATRPSTLIHNQLSENVPSGGGGQNDVHRVNHTSQGASSNVSREQILLSTEDNFRVNTEDIVRVEEAPPYCTTGHYEGASVFSFDHSIYMYRDKVWAGRQVLRVFFLNPEVLRNWGLTTEVILDWAAAWQRHDDERIPIFQKNFAARKADIRVGFSETEGCWSAVGMDAEKIIVSLREPTMLLNLKGLTRQFQRSLVIHEFGHALGLDHEHQRSDFLDVVEKFIDKSKIPHSQRIRVRKTDDMMDREEASSRYDPQSIMHYWFDIQWLQPACRDINNVMRLAGLTRQEKSYLIGLHQRQGEDLLPPEPSRSDLEHLSKAYESSGPREVSNVHPGSRRLPYNQSVDVPPTHPRLGTQPVSRLVSSPAESGDSHVVLRADVHLRAIRNAVWEARAKWRDIGRKLKFSRSDLDTMYGDAGANLESVLVVWMRRGNATIDQLLDVLRSDQVDRRDLADKIEMTRSSGERQALGLQRSDG